MANLEANWPEVGVVKSSTRAHAGALQSDLVALSEFARLEGHIPAALFEKFAGSAHFFLGKAQTQADLADTVEAVSRIDRVTQAIHQTVCLPDGSNASENEAVLKTAESEPKEEMLSRAGVHVPVSKATDDTNALKLVLSDPLPSVG
jgi:hypothetical protein